MTDATRLVLPRYQPVQVEKTPPCQDACLNSGDIRRWIGFIAQRAKLGLTREEAYARAWRTITDVNPFPAVLGRICPHACETLCNRGTQDEPLAINAMEQFLGDYAIRAGLALARLDDHREPPAETIGVVGGGPSGLSFAYQLARRGYRVTVYECRQSAGGMLRYGIPDYRLPPAVLDAEVGRILDLGVELRLGVRVGVDVTLEELRGRHAVVYVGVGAQRGKTLGIPGEDGPGAWTGTEYLGRVNAGEPVELGSRVIVVGGGNTAVDAARTARRSGAEVTLLYRRSRTEMPAIATEVDDAIEEGVVLVLRAAPVRLERQNGRLRELVATRTDLGPPDASGRRQPVPVPDAEFAIPLDAVIAAVSQELDPEAIGALLVNGRLEAEDGLVATNVLAGGDALVQGIAAQAIVQGRLAAEGVHRRLRGEETSGAATPSGRSPSRTGATAAALLSDFFPHEPAHHRARLGPADRLAAGARESTAGLSEAAFLAEAARCLSCGSCFGCEQCAMYCTLGGFTKLREREPGRYFDMVLDRCEACGKCVSVCPCGYLEVAATGKAPGGAEAGSAASAPPI